MQTLANMGQIRSKPVRDVRLSSLYAIVGQYWTNIDQYICATGDMTQDFRFCEPKSERVSLGSQFRGQNRIRIKYVRRSHDVCL